MEITGNTFFFGWEVNLMVWLQSQLNAFGIRLAAFFTQFGEPMILILVVGLFYWGLDKARHRRPDRNHYNRDSNSF